MTHYMTPKDASKQLGIHLMTLRNWAEKKKIDTIRTPGGKRLYDVEGFLKKQIEPMINIENENITKPETNIRRNIRGIYVIVE